MLNKKEVITVVFLSGMESEWTVEMGTEVVVRNDMLFVSGICVARNVDFIERKEVA